MTDSKAVFVASDHAGVALKAELQKMLSNWKWEDLGPKTADRVDYPDYAVKLGEKVRDTGGRGVLICGTGLGMSMAANRIPGIRAAAVSNVVDAKLSRDHNDANVLCIGARTLAAPYAAEIVKAWLTTPFSGGERHQARINKINELDKK